MKQYKLREITHGAYAEMIYDIIYLLSVLK